jgi:transcriptional regulator of acetoin/glycerol metabolism
MWDRLLRSGELPPNTVRTLVEDSWWRCYRAGVDPGRAAAAGPLADDDLLALRERDRELADAGKTIMAQARDLLSQTGMCAGLGLRVQHAREAHRQLACR